MRRTKAAGIIGALTTAAALALAGCGVEGTQEPAAEASTTSTSSPVSTTTTDAGSPESTTTTNEAYATTTTEASTTTSTGPVDDGAKADFVARANEICRLGADALAGREPSTADEAEMTAYITDVFVPAVHQQIDDIRALGLPPGDEGELTALFDATEVALDRLAADPMGVINSGQDPFAGVNQQLIAYGLTDCGAS